MAAITSLATLNATVLNMVNRAGSAPTAAFLEDAMSILEGDLKRRLRIRATKADLAIADGDETVALPAEVAELRTIRYKNDDAIIDARSLLPRSMAQLNELRAQFHLTSGQPRYFTVLDGNLEIVPKADDDYTTEITYMAGYVPVATSEALIAQAPDLYLYGLLTHLSLYLEHDERFPTWGKLYEEALEGLNLQREREEFAMLSRQPVRLPRVFGARP